MKRLLIILSAVAAIVIVVLFLNKTGKPETAKADNVVLPRIVNTYSIRDLTRKQSYLSTMEKYHYRDEPDIWISRNENVIARLYNDTYGCIRIFIDEMQTGKRLSVLTLNSEDAKDLVFHGLSPDEKYFILSYRQKFLEKSILSKNTVWGYSVRYFNTKSGAFDFADNFFHCKFRKVLYSTQNSITGIVLTSSGENEGPEKSNTRIEFLDTNSREKLNTLYLNDHFVDAVLSPDGAKVLVLNEKKTVNEYDRASGDLIRESELADIELVVEDNAHIAFTPDAAYLKCGGIIYDMQTMEHVIINEKYKDRYYLDYPVKYEEPGKFIFCKRPPNRLWRTFITVDLPEKNKTSHDIRIGEFSRMLENDILYYLAPSADKTRALFHVFRKNAAYSWPDTNQETIHNIYPYDKDKIGLRLENHYLSFDFSTLRAGMSKYIDKRPSHYYEAFGTDVFIRNSDIFIRNAYPNLPRYLVISKTDLNTGQEKYHIIPQFDGLPYRMYINDEEHAIKILSLSDMKYGSWDMDTGRLIKQVDFDQDLRNTFDTRTYGTKTHYFDSYLVVAQKTEEGISNGRIDIMNLEKNKIAKSVKLEKYREKYLEYRKDNNRFFIINHIRGAKFKSELLLKENENPDFPFQTFLLTLGENESVHFFKDMIAHHLYTDEKDGENPGDHITVYDTDSGKLLHELPSPSRRYYTMDTIEFINDSTMFLLYKDRQQIAGLDIGTNYYIIRVYDISKGENVISEYRDHENGTRFRINNLNSRYFAYLDREDNKISIFNREPFGEYFSIQDADSIESFTFSSDDNQLYILDSFGKIYIWDLTKKAKICTLQFTNHDGSHIIYTPDNYFSISGKNPEILWFEYKNEETGLTMTGEPDLFSEQFMKPEIIINRLTGAQPANLE